MGIFLSMIQNQKADPDQKHHPDENYARESAAVLGRPAAAQSRRQPQLVGGQPVPTYDQTAVRGFAAVFTGWDWNNTGCGEDSYTCCEYFEDEGWGTYFWCGPSNYNDPPWQLPMQPVEHYHDSTSDKQLLVYPGVSLPNGVLPHGGDAQAEMTQALDNIFNHPNVGPFMAKRLIERLVTSNRGRRTCRVCADLQQQRRGRRAICARSGRRSCSIRSTFRHLRNLESTENCASVLKSLIFGSRWMRADRGQSTLNSCRRLEQQLGQAPLRSPTVFISSSGFAQRARCRTRLVSPESDPGVRW